jgi:hypothetical protein
LIAAPEAGVKSSSGRRAGAGGIEVVGDRWYCSAVIDAAVDRTATGITELD